MVLAVRLNSLIQNYLTLHQRGPAPKEPAYKKVEAVAGKSVEEEQKLFKDSVAVNLQQVWYGLETEEDRENE